MKINFKDIQKIEKNEVDNYLKIQYQPTYWCNYKCFYCIQASSKNTKRELTPKEKVYNTAKKIASKLNYYDGNLALSILGGEVTIPYDIKKIIEPFLNLNIKKFKLIILTNLSNSLEYYIDLLNYCKKNNINLRLIASYHYSDFNVFFNKVKKLNKLKNETVTTKIILTDLPKINGVNSFEAYNKFIEVSKTELIIGRIPNSKNKFFDVDLEKLANITKNEKCSHNYSIITNKEKIYVENLSDIKKFLNENVSNISFKNFICEPDHLVISADEKVSYSSCSQKKYEGTTLDNIEELRPFPRMCRVDNCPLCNINKLKRHIYEN